jgi:3D (Asp-Asp-Asp) domain-containing protein
MRRWWCGALAVVAVCLGVFAPPADGADTGAGTHSQSNPDGHVVAVDPWTVTPGQILQIEGYHFPAGIDVYGEICGDDYLAGSQDCVLDDIGFGGTTSLGSFSLSLKAAIPPAPCPCVAVVFSPQLTTTPSSPVTIVGAPSAPLTPPASAVTVSQPLRVVSAQITGNGPWYSWFGGMAHRTLVLTLQNPNKGVYPHPSLVLTVGKPGSALSTVSTSPLPSLGPNGTTTVHVPVVLPAFAFGNVEVVGAVGDAALKAPIKETTTIIPWGLIVIAALLLQFIFLGIRNAVRRRNRRRAPEAPPHTEFTNLGPLTPSDGTPSVGASKQPEEIGV